MQNFIESFRNSMASDGIHFDGKIFVDSELHRFRPAGDSKGESGWYILFGDGVLAGAYGCWKRDISKPWCAKSKTEMSPQELAQHKERIKIVKEKRDQAKAKAQSIAKIKAENLWNTAKPASDDHPYLLKKQVKGHGIRCFNSSDKNLLLIPLMDNAGVLHSLQFINENGDKSFLTDGAIKGNYFTIKGIEKKIDKIGIVEGAVTGVQINEILGYLVFCAMNCGNLLLVSQAIRSKYPDAEITIFSDNDAYTENNPGLNKAIEAAKAIGAKIKYPDFTGLDVSSRPTDWNDLTLLVGVDEARRRLLEDKSAKEPKQLPVPLAKVFPFESEMLPESIRDYIVDIADRQKCPIDFVAVTAVCALAALLGRKILICPKQHDDWKITPNLWGAVIGRPSTMKSPAMRAALEPLYHIEAEAAKEFEEIQKKYELDQELADLRKSTVKEEVKKFLKENKPAMAQAALEKANSPADDQAPKRKRLIVNDSSVEKLGELLNENPNGLILIRQELAGWLSKLMKEEFQTDRAFYIECFDGSDSFIYDRIGRGTIDIKNLTLSVVGGIQPSRINPLIRDSIKGLCDDGLVQRLQVTVWPDDVGSWQWIDRAPNEEARNKYMKAFYDLNGLSIDTTDGKPSCFRFTEEAQELFIQWIEELQKVARADDIHPALESHLLKMPKIIASLALLFEVLGGGSKVGLKATAQALEWADYLKSHAERLYSSVISPGLTCAHLISKRLDKLDDEFTARDIHRKGWAGLSEIRDIEEGLLCLTDYYHITSREVPSTIGGGRPTVIYTKNKKYMNRNAQ